MHISRLVGVSRLCCAIYVLFKPISRQEGGFEEYHPPRDCGHQLPRFAYPTISLSGDRQTTFTLE